MAIATLSDEVAEAMRDLVVVVGLDRDKHLVFLANESNSVREAVQVPEELVPLVNLGWPKTFVADLLGAYDIAKEHGLRMTWGLA